MEENKEEQKDNEFNYNCELTKIEEAKDGHIYIAGIATTDSLDHDGEIVDADAVKSAWGDYKGVIRYMHGKDSRNPDAVGVMVDQHVDSSGKTWKTEFTPSGPFIVAKISNAPDTESIRTKIREGVISAFSIGGRAKRIKTFDPTLQKDVNRVITTRISEISLVDLPANRDSYFEVLKAACTGPECPLNTDTEPIEKTEGKVPKDWWDNCMGTAGGIPGMSDAAAFCGWMWSHGEEAGFSAQKTAIGKVEMDDPVVSQAVAKFEEIIDENNDMHNTLEKLEEQIENLERANDPNTIVKGEENENNHISTIEKTVEVADQLGGKNMENEEGIVRMEVPELEDFIKSTVNDMATEQETLAKLDDYDRLVAEIKDMRKKIEGLEAQAKANAKALPTTPAMKSEGEVEDAEVVEKAAKKKDKEPEKKYDEDGNEIVESVDMEVIKKMEAEIAELKSSPLYKAQQEEVTVEKTESEPASGLLASVISTHYGGT